MAQIYIGNRQLDLPFEDMEMQWTNWRFRESPRDAFSTDIDIPKTRNNLNILMAAGYLDSQSQPVTDDIRGTLTLTDRIMPVSIQITAVRQESLTIAVYEETVMRRIGGRNMLEGKVDDGRTIYEWNRDSVQRYPDMFVAHRNGSNGVTFCAQIHPSVPLNSIVAYANSIYGNVLESLPDSNLRAIATKKVVCPQNRLQWFESVWAGDTGTSDSTYFRMSGGQHIANDLELTADGQTSITFNRKATVRAKLWTFYLNNVQMQQIRSITLVKNGTDIFYMQLPTDSRRSFVQMWQTSFTVEEGDEIGMRMPNMGNMRYASAVVRFEIDGYGITDEDYDRELRYCFYPCRLHIMSAVGGIDNYPEEPNRHIVFDGNNGIQEKLYWYKRNGQIQNDYDYVVTERSCMSYFGLWCNMPEITVSDFYFNLQRIIGRKLIDTDERLEWGDFSERIDIDGVITSTYTSSEHLGRRNILKMEGEESPVPTSEIANNWLSETSTITENRFRYNGKSGYCSIPQYSNIEVAGQAPPKNPVAIPVNQLGEYGGQLSIFTADFDDVGFCVARMGVLGGSVALLATYIRTDDFEPITQSIQVDIETFSNVNDKDYVTLDGRTYMVMEGSKEINSRKSTISALLIPTL